MLIDIEDTSILQNAGNLYFDNWDWSLETLPSQMIINIHK